MEEYARIIVFLGYLSNRGYIERESLRIFALEAAMSKQPIKSSTPEHLRVQGCSNFAVPWGRGGKCSCARY